MRTHRLTALIVSTHSRSKAAASSAAPSAPGRRFQLTAARRRLPRIRDTSRTILLVSTHSRSKAAAFGAEQARRELEVSTHSRSKAAARLDIDTSGKTPSFNSQPLEGGCFCCAGMPRRRRGFNSQPLEGGCHSRVLRRNTIQCFNSQPLEGGCKRDAVCADCQ